MNWPAGPAFFLYEKNLDLKFPQIQMFGVFYFVTASPYARGAAIRLTREADLWAAPTAGIAAPVCD